MQYHLKKLTLLLSECVPQPASDLLLRLVPASPELVLVRDRQLRQGCAHRRRARHRSASSGQHSLPGAEHITGIPTPVRERSPEKPSPQPCNPTIGSFCCFMPLG